MSIILRFTRKMTAWRCRMVFARVKVHPPLTALHLRFMSKNPGQSSGYRAAISVCLLISACLATGATNLANASTEDLDLQQIFATQTEILSLQSDFIQTKTLSFFEDALVSSGAIFIEKPDFYCWVYSQPEQSVFYVEGLRAGSFNPETQVRQESGLNNSLGLAGIIQSLTPLLSGNLDEASQLEYHISKNPPTEDLLSYTFQPRKQKLQSLFERVTIRFDKNTRLARDLTIEEENGDSTLVEFAGWRINIPVDRSLLVHQAEGER